MRVIFFGTPEFAVPSLRRIMDMGHVVPLVVTQQDKVKGRGHVLSEPPVKMAARQYGLTVLQPPGIRSDEVTAAISEAAPELIVVVAYGRILPPALLRLPRRGCLNVHASLLPKYRGAAPIQWAIIRGEKKTGVTTMMMDEGLDSGDMLLSAETEISDEDTALTVGERLSKMGADLLERTMDGMIAGTVRPLPQRGEATYAPILRKDDGRIVWSRPARDLFNLVRGTFPWPGAFCFLAGQRMTIVRSAVAPGNGTPGRIEQIRGDDVVVGTGNGLLVISEMRPDGRKAMPAGACMRGRRITEGAAFETGI